MPQRCTRTPARGRGYRVRDDDLERAAACVHQGADVLVLDIAHGHSDHCMQMIRKLKERFPNIPLSRQRSDPRRRTGPGRRRCGRHKVGEVRVRSASPAWSPVRAYLN
jgi:hypothetical protein